MKSLVNSPRGTRYLTICFSKSLKMFSFHHLVYVFMFKSYCLKHCLFIALFCFGLIWFWGEWFFPPPFFLCIFSVHLAPSLVLALI